jgi:hypothetical protein
MDRVCGNASEVNFLRQPFVKLTCQDRVGAQLFDLSVILRRGR